MILDKAKNIIAVLVVTVLMQGCRSEVVEDAAVEEVSESQQELSLGFDEPVAAPPPPPPPPPRREITLEDNAGVDELFAVLDQLENDAAFTEAWQMARDYRSDNPENPRIGEVDERITRLNRLRRDAPELVYAINQLSDPNPTVRDIVQRQLVRGGEAARILLRKAVREDSAQVCIITAGLLRQMGVHEAFGDIAGRLVSTGDEQLRRELINICAQMLEVQNSNALEISAGILANADAADYIPLATALYRRLANGQLAGQPAPAELRQVANAYLKRLKDAVAGDPVLLREVSTAAAMSGDKALMAEFLQPGLLYYYYEAGRNQITSAHANDEFELLEPKRSGVTNVITIALRDRQEDIGLVFAGQIDIREEGEYTFYTSSDDGSFLFVGDKLLVDNGGLHGMQERSGTIALAPGLHPFRVTWFQAGGGLGLEVYWEGPGFERGPIPPELFFHNIDDEISQSE